MLQKLKGQSWIASPSHAYLGYSVDEFGYMLWDLLDKNMVWSRDIVFMEVKTIEDWRQQKLVSSSQLAIVMESALVDLLYTTG